MKKLLIITLMFTAFSGFSQNQKTIAVSPDKMNVFYIGVDNPVEIAVPGIEYDSLIVSITNGNIYKKEEGKYIVKVRNVGRTSINAELKIGDSIINLPPKQFRCYTIPTPVTTLGDPSASYFKGGEISKSELLSLDSINAYMANFVFDFSYKITGFNLTANIDGFDETASSKSSNFTDMQKQIIERVDIAEANYVIIENVRVTDTEGLVTKINNLVLRIIE